MRQTLMESRLDLNFSGERNLDLNLTGDGYSNVVRRNKKGGNQFESRSSGADGIYSNVEGCPPKMPMESFGKKLSRESCERQVVAAQSAAAAKAAADKATTDKAAADKATFYAAQDAASAGKGDSTGGVGRTGVEGKDGVPKAGQGKGGDDKAALDVKSNLDTSSDDDNILGMKPMVAYSVIGGAVLLLGIGGFVWYKKHKAGVAKVKPTV